MELNEIGNISNCEYCFCNTAHALFGLEPEPGRDFDHLSGLRLLPADGPLRLRASHFLTGMCFDTLDLIGLRCLNIKDPENVTREEREKERRLFCQFFRIETAHRPAPSRFRQRLPSGRCRSRR